MMQGSLLSPFEPPVAEMPKWKNVEMFQHLSLRVFCESRLRVSRFREIRLQGISLPLGTPGGRNAEMPKYPGVQSMAHNDPWDRRFQFESRFRDFANPVTSSGF
jgi:hypothetical protein